MTDEDLKKIHYELLSAKGTNVKMVNELLRYIYTLKSEHGADFQSCLFSGRYDFT